MRYRSFHTRDYLFLKNIKFNKNLSVLEIGTGLGSIVDDFKGKIKEYYGVDIAPETIDYLSSQYKKNSSVNLFCLDVCSLSSNLNKKFDVIISADTLEHVELPQNYFNFIERHLKNDGIALVTFPNESKEKHHGITWFEKKSDLFDVILKNNLRIVRLCEVKNTPWHLFVKKYFWQFPKYLISKNKENPQVFDGTEAFNIISSRGVKVKIFTVYAALLNKIASLFLLHTYRDIENDIKNKVLFTILKKQVE